MDIHFYPGQNLLIINRDGRDIARFEAMGGPSKMGNDPQMAEEPTWPGTYIIDKAEAYRTPTWPMSKLTWGTELMDMPLKRDIWYALPSGKWGSLNQLFNTVTRDAIMDMNHQLYGKRIVPSRWVFNDFGPVAIRWYKDLNGNKVLDGKEVLSGQMFHTTPDNEAETALGLPVRLAPSHGCIHLKPNDRDRLFTIGAFTRGTLFTVYKYHETHKAN
ncbi:L,D-transpeptidase family protein [Shewanella sp. OMA3-2]|uniref:L,D-transpeptidase family protein n=1 Tax=Shewanella sp. OMA3-2 TaxID=2908650 RepID=UPI001F008222|nr:L,D-transpeptidase family protein [Shewanella sp. OMA3-2]UJF22005.1 L,D-transpeptidase family protein [Shewanella sp. OMA3-2]